MLSEFGVVGNGCATTESARGEPTVMRDGSRDGPGPTCSTVVCRGALCQPLQMKHNLVLAYYIAGVVQCLVVRVSCSSETTPV